MKRELSVRLDTDKPAGDLVADVRDAVRELADRTSDGDGSPPEVALMEGEPLLLSNFADVERFHRRFGVPMASEPAFLDVHAASFRVKFMQEELDEYCEALVSEDLAKAGDALIDLVYVALGTASMMGLPWHALWAEVQRANMSKERAKPDGSDSKRGSSLDVVKPPGWAGPDHSQFVGRGPWPTFMTSTGQLVFKAPPAVGRRVLPTDSPVVAEAVDRMARQRAEFDACDRLAAQMRRVNLTPVVDDDYPAVRHAYEGALREFIAACAANERLP